MCPENNSMSTESPPAKKSISTSETWQRIKEYERTTDDGLTRTENIYYQELIETLARSDEEKPEEQIIDAAEFDFVYLGAGEISNNPDQPRPRMSPRSLAEDFYQMDHTNFLLNSYDRSLDYYHRYAVWRSFGMIVQNQLGYTKKNGLRFEMEENILFLKQRGSEAPPIEKDSGLNYNFDTDGTPELEPLPSFEPVDMESLDLDSYDVEDFEPLDVDGWEFVSGPTPVPLPDRSSEVNWIRESFDPWSDPMSE